MFSKINVLHIVKSQVGTWIDDSTGNKKIGDFVLFIGGPVLVGLLLTFFLKVALETDLITLLATILSIVSALLFNLLILIFDISGKNEEKLKNENNRLAELLKQIYINISFSIVVSIAALIVVVLAYFSFWPGIIYDLLRFLAFGLITLFLLTLFMILKRIDILLFEDFKRYEKK